ncbi:daptide biosynthesis intramembrane metalloprotease [Micromonospora sp. SL4-19]|uniref:daptide biosynthesis intramembrane metalloprotease n=1 Tax=Micromonospora sp. SL4-19 TaxID=3399129 RepID=UPI003A4D2719
MIPSATAVPPDYAQRPRPAPGTEVHLPAVDGDPYVIQRGPKYVRVGRDVARLARAMDGQSDHAALSEALGPPWTVELVAQAVEKLDKLGLVDRGDMVAPRRAPRIKVVPPFTIQLTLVRPGRAMQALRPVLGAFASRFVSYAALAIGLGGIIALVVQSAAVAQVLAEPLAASTYVGVLLALIVATSIHELGHAATLLHYGGHPARIGVMLYYLMPAFFCDVSDSWRLPRRDQRVRVALAGPAVQTFLAGVSALLALLPAQSGLRTGLLFFAVVCYLTGLLNLLPFIKLDGYLALMTRVDVPFLRTRAMTDARRAIARLLFGGRYERELSTRWTTWYGLACLGFPVYLLGTALGLWAEVLQGGGVVGLILLACVVGYLLYVMARGLRRTAREVRAAGAPRWRVLLGTGVLVGGLGALMVLPLPYSVSGAFISRSGTTELVLLDGADTASLAPGQTVELARNGLIVQGTLGEATIAPGPGQASTAPLSSFFPLRLDSDPDLPVTSYRLVSADGAVQNTAGVARVDVGTLPLWKLLYRTYVHPFLH